MCCSDACDSILFARELGPAGLLFMASVPCFPKSLGPPDRACQHDLLPVQAQLLRPVLQKPHAFPRVLHGVEGHLEVVGREDGLYGR